MATKITVDEVTQNVTVTVSNERGPAGQNGGGSWGTITGTLSDQTDLQAALDLKAPLASPALTGTPTAPTAATTTSTTQIATTAFVQQELAAGTATAKNVEVFVRNETGATLTKGTIVYINGSTGNRPTITKAQANGDATSAQTIGFVKTDIAHNAEGFVITSGDLENVNTGGLTAGQQLYLSPSVAGQWTTTKPSAPDHLVYVGIVVRPNNSVGIIYVAIQNGYELNELHDVAAQTPSAGQFLKRNAENTLWVNSGIVSADVTDATSSSTSNAIVRRDANGSASFGVVSALSVSAQFLTQSADYGDLFFGAESGTSDNQILKAIEPGQVSPNFTLFSAASQASDRSYTLPDASGTLMLGSQNLSELTDAATARANLGAAAANIPIFYQLSASRTLSASDLGAKIRVTTAGGCAITIPAGLGIDGAAIIVRRATGAGAISLTLGAGVTVNNSGVASIAAGQEFALVAVGANEWDFV